MICAYQKNIAINNWLKASNKLAFNIITPYSIIIEGKPKEIFAFLPNYGSPNGSIVVLITSQFEIDNEIINWAKSNGIFYSFIYIDSFFTYDEEFFKEILLDWGYFSKS